jgi:hypothetical protein
MQTICNGGRHPIVSPDFGKMKNAAAVFVS